MQYLHNFFGENEHVMQSKLNQMGIVDALENHDADLAEKLVRDHLMGLAKYIEQHAALTG